MNGGAPTYGELARRARPSLPNQPETIPWAWYDTQTYPAAGVADLTFFQTVSSDKSISNMKAGGELTEPEFFVMDHVFVDILAPVTSTAEGVTGALDEIERLVRSSRAIWEFFYKDKRYGTFPLTLLHGTGGPTGFGWGVDNVAAGGTPTQTQYANNGLLGGGWRWPRRMITLEPKTSFSFTIRWPGTPPTVAADRRIRVLFAGDSSRAVT